MSSPYFGRPFSRSWRRQGRSRVRPLVHFLDAAAPTRFQPRDLGTGKRGSTVVQGKNEVSYVPASYGNAQQRMKDLSESAAPSSLGSPRLGSCICSTRQPWLAEAGAPTRYLSSKQLSKNVQVACEPKRMERNGGTHTRPLC